MDLSEWKQAGSYFRYKKKFNIFYQEATNEKEVLLLLHGFPTSSWDWNKIWQPLAGKFHLIAPDFLGYGLSNKPKRYKYSTHDQSDMVESLLNDKGIEKAHVLAHDLGDTVFQELLARNIDRAKGNKKGIVYNSVCLLNGGILPEGHHPRPIQMALLSPFGFMLTPFLNKKKLRKNFHGIFGNDTPPTDQEIDEFYELMEREKGKYIFHKLIRYMSDRKQYRERWVGALQKCPVPIRFINGNADPVSGKHLSDTIKWFIPHIAVIDLPKIGHYPHIEAPDEVLRHFLEFHA